MVFFTCNHCGESLKKQSVEKHYKWQKCKGAPVFVTCVDCLKDFREQEYVGHTKCITEAERYYGKDYQAKPSQNKGQKKQEAWTDIIQSVLQRSDLSTRIQGVLKTLTMHENVPRKKPKFLNFMKNVSRQTSTYDATRIFELIEEAYQHARVTQKVDTPEGKESAGDAEPQDDVKNGDTGNVPEGNGHLETPNEKKKKKRKAEKNENGHEDLGTQEQVQEPQDEDKNEDTENVPEENGHLETPKEKKKKKRKAEKNENGLEALGTQEQVQEEEKPKKKRKKNVEEAKIDSLPDDVTDAVDVGKTSNNQEKQPGAVEEEEKMEEKIDEPPKEKSKKKRKNQEDTEESAKVDESSEPKKKKKKKEMNGQVPEDKNEDTETKIPEEESFNKGKKRKEVIEQIKNDAKEDNFSWNNSIKEILQKSDGSITLEKLKKRLIKNYLKMHPDCVEISNKIDLIVNRRLRKMKKVSLDNGVVTLKA
uniref:Putative cell growth-regulating nucleolar protein n=1 Tax=Nyssomyia neivai TaxID=330878 RepID=A0A1L8DI57_9DIPT